MNVIEAVFTGGTFHPIGDVDLPENQRVRLRIDPVPTSPAEWLARTAAFRRRVIESTGELPDSTAEIRADRDRDG